ncbi:MAG: hypothetical protein CFH41_00813 [Alphaproteobacteria bacterium MarineAlpha11_Bin1]|nr:MAG: hypothetical protein CFH41_00813 [Alphaproteobacteria bacterium MarineAlpha11_Bin1]|tara:strand:- start:7832 stop:8746 length:915 start_codon:yes stop_codon:yes gene_type:complete
MAKFLIQPHGRLNDWVAEKKGYFVDEGLNYVLNAEVAEKSTPPLAEALDPNAPIKENLYGAFERYAEGHGRKGTHKHAGDVSCACHWTVNQSASLQDGIMYGNAYSVCEAAIMVPPGSSATKPEKLAGVEVAVGYHSGSHYSALQALEVFLEEDDIVLKFVGTSWSRVDAALAGKIPAVNVWGPQLYILEQRGFTRVVSTTFMMGYIFPRDAELEDVEKYIRALVRAQADIDATPEKYKRYFLNEIPERYLNNVDVRRFGVGERIVPQPYTRDMFDKTQTWMHERKLFNVGSEAGVSYEIAVHR